VKESLVDPVGDTAPRDTSTDFEWPSVDTDIKILWLDESVDLGDGQVTAEYSLRSGHEPESITGSVAEDYLERFATEPPVGNNRPQVEAAQIEQSPVVRTSPEVQPSPEDQSSREVQSSPEAKPPSAVPAPQPIRPPSRAHQPTERRWPRFVAWGTAAAVCGAIAGTYTRQLVDTPDIPIVVIAPAAAGLADAGLKTTTQPPRMSPDPQPTPLNEVTPAESNAIASPDSASQTALVPPPRQATATPRQETVVSNEPPPPPISPANDQTVAQTVAAAPIARVDPIQPAAPVLAAVVPATPPAPSVAESAPTAGVPAISRAPSGGAPEDQRIQEVLRQYQNAYDHLDAAGAKAIWPTVDVGALSRAFDGLSSQDVTFDRCDLSVAGASARAVCEGRATYVRKIGRKDPHTEPRQWIFELRKTDSSWMIAQSETR